MNVFDPQVFEPSPAAPAVKFVEHRGKFFERVAWSSDVAPENTHAHGSKRLGLMYERRVLDVFDAIYGAAFTRSPVIHYFNRHERRRAIPDGILRIDIYVYIIEVKLRHTPVAWTQLVDLYSPLVEALEPYGRVRPVEVCGSYDPAVVFGSHKLVDSIHAIPPRNTTVEVLQWKI